MLFFIGHAPVKVGAAALPRKKAVMPGESFIGSGRASSFQLFLKGRFHAVLSGEAPSEDGRLCGG
jgi:hypothetical protein